jgi:anti-sigma B factor antagonist
MTERPREFAIESAPLGGAPGVVVRGEVDVSTAPRLADALDVAIRGSEGAFVIDLSDLDFLDSTGVSVFVRARALLGRDERPLMMLCPPGPARRIFEVTGIIDLFAFYDSREHAVGAHGPHQRPPIADRIDPHAANAHDRLQ